MSSLLKFYLKSCSIFITFVFYHFLMDEFMHLQHLHVLNYKNIAHSELSFTDGINCFVGPNGAGKTNLLDVIYYLSFCKSYFNAVESHNISHDEDFFVIQGRFNRLDKSEQIYVALKRNQKKVFKRNKKEYAKLSDHIGLLPLVMISPSDERLIVEGSDQRRKYMDSVISQYNKSFLELLIRYNRALNQRNTLLKSENKSSVALISQLEVWDEQLAVMGVKIFEQRTSFMDQLVPVFKNLYQYITDGNEEVDIVYRSHFQRGDLLSLLRESRQRDLALGYTTRGIHKDDLELMFRAQPVKREGSQGQKKSFLIALKLAQYEFLTRFNGFGPLLLLDDVFDKLDADRGDRLIKLVGEERFRQIFITDTQKERLSRIVDKTGKDFRFFNVHEGCVTVNGER